MKLQEQAYKDTVDQNIFFSVLSWPISKIFLFLVIFRRFLYDKNILKSTSLPGKVISVGNIVAGGTGKSPVVLSLVEYLKSKNLSLAILTRGYKSGLEADEWNYLLNGQVQLAPKTDKDYYFDEPRMLSSTIDDVPVIVGRNRLNAANEFLQLSHNIPDVWILDDGYQHLKIKRDINIVLLDSSFPLGNQHMLPKGTLREPASHLKFADLIFFTRSKKSKPIPLAVRDSLSKFSIPSYNIIFEAKRFYSIKGDSIAEFDIKEMPVLLVCGIAKPKYFIDSINNLNIKISKKIILKDHEPIKRNLLCANISECKSIVTSSKDYWRDPSVFNSLQVPVYILHLNILVPSEAFEKILEIL